jgi:hypothetical protein
LKCAFDLMPPWVLALMGKSHAFEVQKQVTRLLVQL